MGSLVAALGSYLDARAHRGSWRVRMEDVDEPRCDQAHADSILRALEMHGLEWDGEVAYQSRRTDLYQSALDSLVAAGYAYPCACTRKEIADSSLNGIEGPVYPGTCRTGLKGRMPRAWRVRTNDEPLCIDDRLLGHNCQHLETEVGDFVVKRADGLFAYQLAVVVDDAEQGITHVVRGADLLDSTPRQIHLQHLLGYSSLSYLHLPVVLNEQGQKLSKQTLAPPLDSVRHGQNLIRAMRLLGFAPLKQLDSEAPAEMLEWAADNWIQVLESLQHKT
jgi:glutamyl-Q tRNA(Asp) synthetase